ncbi:MAG TPA: PEP-CTERM sorting domain-containing protein [Candidatus Dormibacteraeota bacterium]|nr:PEP-CTERM sorting domain-containing protein [Candidatus Dormibacteraeota bacterium]
MSRKNTFGIVPLLLCLAAALPAAASPTIWNGPLLSFTKANGANPSLAANQDRITGDLWITRSSSQGLYNAWDEGFFTHFSSPAGTEWANGTLANYSSLSYTDWNSWAKGVNPGPTGTVGIQAVVHIIPDDIYFSIKFTSWTSGGAGGGFSYLRSTALVPEPSSLALLLAGSLLLFKARRRTRPS